MKNKKFITRIFLVLALVISSCNKDENPVTPIVNGTSTQELLDELNLLRANPSGYAAYLEATRQYYNGTLYQEPGEITLQTDEGLAAVDEAISVLRATPKLGLLSLSAGMTRAAQDHVNDTGPKGITGHTGSDGSDPWTRMERYGTWSITAGENISFGMKTARKIMIQFLVDDGVKSRGHRANLLKADYKFAGLFFGMHSEYDYMCVIDFAGSYKEK